MIKQAKPRSYGFNNQAGRVAAQSQSCSMDCNSAQDHVFDLSRIVNGLLGPSQFSGAVECEYVHAAIVCLKTLQNK